MDTWKKLVVLLGAAGVIIASALAYFYLRDRVSADSLAGIVVLLFLFGLLVWTPALVAFGIWIGGRDKKTWNDAVTMTGGLTTELLKIANHGYSAANSPVLPPAYYPSTRIEDSRNISSITRM